MCCFSPLAAPSRLAALLGRSDSPRRIEVGRTRIFARVAGGTQHLVYAMSLSTPADVAMVLPLPVLRARGEAALRFVDLSGYADFFDDLEKHVLPPIQGPLARGAVDLGASIARPRLVVHRVGAFEASFVPSVRDFDRLDRRFRLPEEVWAAHPEYARRDFGFAVFKLARGNNQSIHPMALRFASSEPDDIFFPTLHVHDGKLHDSARFDHHLYYQYADGTEARRERPDGLGAVPYRSSAPARDGVDVDRSRGLVAPDQHVHLWLLSGEHANADTRVCTSAPGGDPSPLRGQKRPLD